MYRPRSGNCPIRPEQLRVLSGSFRPRQHRFRQPQHLIELGVHVERAGPVRMPTTGLGMPRLEDDAFVA